MPHPLIERRQPWKASEAAAQIGADPGRGRVAVTFARTGQAGTLEAEACRFGGHRWWWRCPACDTRRAHLYHLSGLWACRACHGMAYASSRDSRRWDKLIRRMAPGWPLSLGRRMFFDVDLERINLGAPWVDRRGRRWGIRRRRKLVHDALAAGIIRMEPEDYEDIVGGEE